MNSRWLKNYPHPTDRQFAIYIAGHYRAVVTNNALRCVFTMTMIKGESRKFAERSIAEHPAPTEEEIKEADAALKKHLPNAQKFDLAKRPWFPFFAVGVALAVYVCIPALVAALLFRGGLVLLIARVTFVRRTAHGLHVCVCSGVQWWRGIRCCSRWVCLRFSSRGSARLTPGLAGWLLVCALEIVSMALPNRSLPDRLAGTWPVPR